MMKNLLFYKIGVILVEVSCFIALTLSQEMNAKMNSYNLQMTSNSDGTMLKFISPETDVQNTYLKKPPKVQVNDIPLPVALVLPALGLSLTLNPKMSIEGELPEYTNTNVKTNPKIVNVEKVLHTHHDVQPIIKHFARPRNGMNLVDMINDRDAKRIESDEQYGSYIDVAGGDGADGAGGNVLDGVSDSNVRKYIRKSSKRKNDVAGKSLLLRKNKYLKDSKYKNKLKKKRKINNSSKNN